jgi:SAM-dependent methyltransferase
VRFDLACGEGRNAIWLAERGWTVTGVDFSQVAIDKARQLARARSAAVDFQVADLLAYQPPERGFDLVIVFYLQVPASERRAILHGAGAAVASGGTFLLVAHDLRNLDEGYGGPRDAHVLYTPEDVVADLDGLEIERAENVLRSAGARPATLLARLPAPSRSSLRMPRSARQSVAARSDTSRHAPRRRHRARARSTAGARIAAAAPT